MRDPDARVFVAGHRGMVGSAIVRRLESLGYRGRALAADGPIPLSEFDAERHQASPDDPHYINNFLFEAPANAGD